MFHFLLVRRAADGIHWLPMAVRHMTNLLLTHIGELYCTYIQYCVYFVGCLLLASWSDFTVQFYTLEVATWIKWQTEVRMKLGKRKWYDITKHMRFEDLTMLFLSIHVWDMAVWCWMRGTWHTGRILGTAHVETRCHILEWHLNQQPICFFIQWCWGVVCTYISCLKTWR